MAGQPWSTRNPHFGIRDRIQNRTDAHGMSLYASGSLKNLYRSILNYPDYIFFDIDSYLYSGKEKEGAEPE